MGERQLISAFTDRSCPLLVIPSAQGAMAGGNADVWSRRFAAFGLVGALLVGWFFITSAQAKQIQAHISAEQIEIVDHGIYEPMKGKLPKGVPPYNANDVQLVAVTNFIPAQLGIKFGFRYRIVGQTPGAPVAIKTVMLFPSAGLISPTEGRIHSLSISTTERVGRLKAIAYRIDEPWQLVPGTWTIQLWAGSQKLAEQAFTVRPQQTAMN